MKQTPDPKPAATTPARGWVHLHSATLVDLFRVVDAAWLTGSLWLACALFESAWMSTHMIATAIALTLFTVTSGQWPLYRSWRAAPLSAELRGVSLCWVAAFTPTIALLFALESWLPIPRPTLLVWALTSLIAMAGTRIALRLALHSLRRHGANFRTAAIVGANGNGVRLGNELLRNSWMGLRLYGYFDDRVEAVGKESDSVGDRRSPIVSVAGSIDDLIEFVRTGAIDIVYIALPLRAEQRIQHVLAQLRDSTVTVYYVPDFSAFGLLHASWDTIAGMPLIGLIDTPHRGTNGASKRIFDIVASTLLLAVLALPLLCIGLAIRLDSPGPMIYRQKRYGLDGREFEIYKFRSMSSVPKLEDVFVQATREDPRITRLGRWLRRSSVDELPQLLNVLQGRMSLVGPRPHPVALNEAERKRISGYMLRHKVRPGITGWAQINGYRGETDTPEKMEGRVRMDLEYINDWSLMLDLRILWLTLFRVVNDRHAY